MYSIIKVRYIFKVLSILISIIFIVAGAFLFSLEMYLKKDNKTSFKSTNLVKINEDVKPLEGLDIAREAETSNKIVRFSNDVYISDEAWARESYFIESLWKGFNLVSYSHWYLSDFYKINTADLFIKNRGEAKRVSDMFTIRVNTLPLDREKESILVIGDSFVSGFNTIDDNRIFYQIFVDKVRDYYGEDYFNVISAGGDGWGFYDYLLNASNLIKYIDIDYLVIGFLPNDASNADISILRGNYNNGLEYLNCINGREWFSKLFLMSYNKFPNSSRAIVKIYCDRYLKVNGNDRSLDQEKSKGLFKESLLNLKNFSKKNGFEVIFMPLNPMENSGIIRDESHYELISDAGFDIIPSKNSDLIVKEKNKSGWVNPIDWHPSVGLSYAYAMDMYQYFLDRFKIEGNGDDSKKDFIFGKGYEMLNYISSIKPKDLNFTISSNEIRLDNIGKDMLFTTKGYYQFLGISENEKYKDMIYPPQSALCAKINRAHIELAFNTGFINKNNSFTVKNNHKDNSIIVAPKGYGSSGEDLYSEGYLLLPGEYVSLKNQGNLIIASEKEGCAIDEEIKLPELDISIKLI